MPTYAGVEELQDFIVNTKDPSFEGFITKYSAQLADFSLSTPIFSSDTYYAHWRTNYVMQIRELRPKLPIKPSKYAKKLWQRNFRELLELRSVTATYRCQSLRALAAGAKQAGKRTRKALGVPAEENEEENGKGDEEQTKKNEETQSSDTSVPKGQDQEEDEKVDLEDGQQELAKTDKLIKLYLLYIKGETITGEDKVFLEMMSKKVETVQERVFSSAAGNLLVEGGWDNEMNINTKLCISSIVNLISPKSTKFFKAILSTDQFKQVDDTATPQLQGLSAECLEVFDELINESTIMDVESIVENIHKHQLKYCRRMNSDVYKMLGILHQVILQFDDWKDDPNPSETTVYRRFAVLLDHLFRNTSIIMKDGECVARTTQDAMVVLQALSGQANSCGQYNIYGSKIDLIAKTCLDGEEYELSSNEWKRAGASNSTLLVQQAKNLRTNAAILSKLVRLGGLPWTLAMDWAGPRGYAYSIQFTDGVFVAKPYQDLMIPARATQLPSFKHTLDFLFTWKNALMKLVVRLDQQVDDMTIRGIVKIKPCKQTNRKLPPVVITPTPRKRNAEQMDKDADE